MFSVRSATFAAHRVPSHAVPSPRAAGAPLQLGAAIPGSQHRHLPEGSPAHTPHSSHRADSPRVYFAAIVLLHHRPCRMTAESGAPARVRPTRRPWL